MDSKLVLVIVGLLIGLSKGGLGGPVPVALVTPLLSQIMPAAQAVGIVLPLLIFADGFALWAYWRQWNGLYIRRMLPLGIVGVVMGVVLLAALAPHDTLLRRVLGLFTLTIILYKTLGGQLSRVKYQSRAWHAYLAGWASGFGSALANVGAPPFTAYMLLQEVSPRVFVGTTTLFFAIINVLKLPGFLSAGVLNLTQLASLAWVALLIPLGVWLGRRFVSSVNPHVFEWIMLAALFLASLSLLLSPAR